MSFYKSSHRQFHWSFNRTVSHNTYNHNNDMCPFDTHLGSFRWFNSAGKVGIQLLQFCTTAWKVMMHQRPHSLSVIWSQSQKIQSIPCCHSVCFQGATICRHSLSETQGIPGIQISPFKVGMGLDKLVWVCCHCPRSCPSLQGTSGDGGCLSSSPGSCPCVSSWKASLPSPSSASVSYFYRLSFNSQVQGPSTWESENLWVRVQPRWSGEFQAA